MMNAEEIEEWLENWVENNLNAPNYYENKEAMADEARTCFAEAERDGILAADLTAAAGGDLKAYLLGQQNALTDREVQRLVHKDPH